MHIVAVAFIHRFGSSLNEHVHLHVCAGDGVFVELVGKVTVTLTFLVGSLNWWCEPTACTKYQPSTLICWMMSVLFIRQF